MKTSFIVFYMRQAAKIKIYTVSFPQYNYNLTVTKKR